MSASLFGAPIALLDTPDAAIHLVPREAEQDWTKSGVFDQPAERVVQPPDKKAPPGLPSGLAAKLRRRPPPPSLTAEQRQIIAGRLEAACRCRACITAGRGADAADVLDCDVFLRAVLEWLREFANRHLRPGDRDDFVQEVGRRAVEKLHEFDCDPTLASFSTWLWDVAEHHRIDLWRKRFARRRTRALRPDDELIPDSSDDGPSAKLDRQEDRRHVLMAMDELHGQVAEDDYRILYLCEIRELPVNEVAVLIGMRPAMVCDRHRRVKEKLRRILRRSG